MKHEVKICLLIITLLSIFSNAKAQTKPSEVKHTTITATANSHLNRMYKWQRNWEWTATKWSNDDIYTSIRQNLDIEFAKTININVLNMKYEKAANLHPEDSKALFRWGYLTYKVATKKGSGIESAALKLADVNEAFPFATTPHSYQYLRLRFLIVTEITQGIGFHELIGLGERLILQQPNDFDVKYDLIMCLLHNDGEDQFKALSLTESLIQSNANTPSVYALLGGIYYSLWFNSGNKNYGEKSIAAYKRYLQLAPSYYEFRKDAEANIKWIQLKSPN